MNGLNTELITMNGKHNSDQEYYVSPTSITPMIKFVPNLGLLELKGRSSPENAIEFYEPINLILDRFENMRISKLQANVEFEYFNTSSLKCIYNLLKKVSIFSKKNIAVSIHWHYEIDDEDIMEAGKDISDLINHEFQFIEINSCNQSDRISA